ncbi:MAG: hypothetical protein R3314_01785 [Longimicrobiales bacterium]|nr:hypothetical protein [Longimicrobiales bacterium]
MHVRRIVPVLLAVLLVVVPGTSCGDSSPAGPDNDDGGDPYSHTLAPGASANDFLSDQTFTSLVVEVDYMAGHQPSSSALDDLRAFLEARVHKTSITVRSPTEIPAGGQPTYTANEVVQLENEHRNAYTDGQTLTAYMLVVDGEFEEANVLGAAYFNTSSVYFGGAIDQVSGGPTQPSETLVEATTFLHEFGHLFGLVAIEESGTEMQTEHQDEAHGHHCDNDQCLMYYAVESTDLFGGVFGGDIPSLDQNCIDDLQANGGK